MVLAAPEFIIAERVVLIDEIEVAAELQHRMLADRVVRGEEGSELEARHGFLSGRNLLLITPHRRLRAGERLRNRANGIAAQAECCHARSRWIAWGVRL